MRKKIEAKAVVPRRHGVESHLWWSSNKALESFFDSDKLQNLKWGRPTDRLTLFRVFNMGGGGGEYKDNNQTNKHCTNLCKIRLRSYRQRLPGNGVPFFRFSIMGMILSLVWETLCYYATQHVKEDALHWPNYTDVGMEAVAIGKTEIWNTIKKQSLPVASLIKLSWEV
jgi:hypothetical protein